MIILAGCARGTMPSYPVGMSKRVSEERIIDAPVADAMHATRNILLDEGFLSF